MKKKIVKVALDTNILISLILLKETPEEKIQELKDKYQWVEDFDSLLYKNYDSNVIFEINTFERCLLEIIKGIVRYHSFRYIYEQGYSLSDLYSYEKKFMKENSEEISYYAYEHIEEWLNLNLLKVKSLTINDVADYFKIYEFQVKTELENSDSIILYTYGLDKYDYFITTDRGIIKNKELKKKYKDKILHPTTFINKMKQKSELSFHYE